MQPLQIVPIATVVGGHTEVLDDYQGGVESIIRYDATYPLEMVQRLDEFSHLTVVWHFHLASPDDVHLHARSPRNNPRWPATGPLAHRNHRRPNQLGISHPRLLSIDGRDLLVTDLDAVDSTPVIDIGPWFTDMGPRGPVREPAWPGEMLKDYWRPASSR
ncbi:TrmO family methyltransferase domain-containing protein [Streptomyces anthocyanicus]|uniref:TrmO family methyltransferase domain-containing protein n=1 Tax=Streptomyces anthocyanicus TaxID=68174 RepID=UPI00382C0FB0